MALRNPNRFEEDLASRTFSEGSDKLTTADNAGDELTNDDNASDTTTLSDKSRQLERTTVRLAAWQKSHLQRIADSEGRLLSDVVREAVRQYLRGR